MTAKRARVRVNGANGDTFMIYEDLERFWKRVTDEDNVQLL